MIASTTQSWIGRVHRVVAGPLFRWRAHRLKSAIYPELRESTRRKFAGGRDQQAKLTQYAQLRAAQLAHLRIDDLMRRGTHFDALEANRLLVRAAELAAAKVVRDVPKRS